MRMLAANWTRAIAILRQRICAYCTAIKWTFRYLLLLWNLYWNIRSRELTVKLRLLKRLTEPLLRMSYLIRSPTASERHQHFVWATGEVPELLDSIDVNVVDTDSTGLSETPIEEVRQDVRDNIKITSIDGNPESMTRFCNRVLSLLRLWDWALLFDREDTFNFAGNRDSYLANTGILPQSLAMKFIDKAPKRYELVPENDKADLANALVDYWLLRASTWRANHRTREEVREEWWPETYGEPYWKNDAWAGFQDLATFSNAVTVGEYPVPLYRHEYPVYNWRLNDRIRPMGMMPEHVPTARIVRLTSVPPHIFAVRVLDIVPCHFQCPVASNLLHLSRAVIRIVAAQCSVPPPNYLDEIYQGSVSNLRVVAWLRDDPLADNDRGDVLYFVPEDYRAREFQQAVWGRIARRSV